MTTRTQQSFISLQGAAITEGSTTPNPGVVNTIALSTLTMVLMRWTGSTWTGLGSAGVPTLVNAEQTYTVATDRQAVAFVPMVIDGTVVLNGTLVMI